MDKERISRVESLKAQMNKKYGKGFIGTASQMMAQSVPRIPTGITPVDMATGGGLPIGRTTMLYGDESSAKTTTMLKWIAQAQKRCSNCYQTAEPKVNKKTGEVTGYKCDCKKGYREFIVALIDVEGTYEREWGSKLGVNNESLMYTTPEFGEQCVDIVDAWLRSGDVDALCLDSVAQLLPAEEMQKSAEDNLMGVHARLLNSACRKWGGALNHAGKMYSKRPTLVLINQIRHKLGVVFGSPEVKPGGKGQNFLTALEIKFSNGKIEIDDKTKTPLWATKKFKVAKSKVSPPGKAGEFSIVLTDVETKHLGDLMEEEFVFDEMTRLGLLHLEKEGGRIVLIGEERLNGKGNVVRYWMQNPGQFEEAKNLLLQYALK